MFWLDIAKFLQYFRNLSNSFINITMLQDINGIFSKYSLNMTVVRGKLLVSLVANIYKYHGNRLVLRAIQQFMSISADFRVQNDTAHH